MGGFQQYFDIILFAMVAGFLVLRLRSVLGRRTGNERRRELFARRPAPATEKVVTLVEPEKRSSRPTDEASRGDVVTEGLKQIRRADPSFDPGHFLDGAKTAYEMIVMSFAEGDEAALKQLLSTEVFEGFESAIRERESRGEKVESNLVSIDKTDIIESDVKNRTAHVTVKFVSELISVTRDAEGEVVEGDPKKVREVTDIWTFARDITSKNPNWKLVATEAAN